MPLQGEVLLAPRPVQEPAIQGAGSRSFRSSGCLPQAPGSSGLLHRVEVWSCFHVRYVRERRPVYSWGGSDTLYFSCPVRVLERARAIMCVLEGAGPRCPPDPPRHASWPMSPADDTAKLFSLECCPSGPGRVNTGPGILFLWPTQAPTRMACSLSCAQ